MYASNYGQAEIKVIYENTDITQLVNTVTWSGDTFEACRTLNVNISNTINGDNQAVNFENGKQILFYNNGSELFRGILFSSDINEKGMTYLTAYDTNVYLTKNVDTRKFVNKKASEIVKRLCDDFGIPYGNISDTGYVIPKLILRDFTLYDMIITALTVTRKQTGRRFFITNKNGKLSLVERKNQVSKWVIENDVNIQSANYSQSIEDMRTQIKVLGGDTEKNPLIATVKDSELMNRFGVMQHLETVTNDLTRSQIEQRAKELLGQLGTIKDDAYIDAIGIEDVISGTSIYASEKMTGISGSFYVINDSHTFANGSHRMSVTLSATDDLPIIEMEVD